MDEDLTAIVHVSGVYHLRNRGDAIWYTGRDLRLTVPAGQTVITHLEEGTIVEMQLNTGFVLGSKL